MIGGDFQCRACLPDSCQDLQDSLITPGLITPGKSLPNFIGYSTLLLIDECLPVGIKSDCLNMIDMQSMSAVATPY